MALPVFDSIHDAKKQGFEPYDHAPTIFLVRRHTETGWELAIVQLTLQPSPKP